MRGSINIIAAARGEIDVSAGVSGDFNQSAPVIPTPVFLGSASVPVTGGASPTNATITLTRAVPGLGSSAALYDDEFSSAPWRTHRTYQTGDLWGYTQTTDTAGNGLAQGPTWWANPIATPQAATVYPAPSGGALSLGLMNTPAGIGISQATIGALINNQRAGGLQLFGYHEMRVRVPAVPGFLFHWNIEDYPNSPSLTAQIDLDIWTDTSGVRHVRFSIPSGLPNNPTLTVIYQTTLDITQYHVYQVNWQPDHITVGIDFTQVAAIPTPGGDFLTQPMFAYFLTSSAQYNVGDGAPSAASLPVLAQIDYYRVYANIPNTAGTVLVHAYNPGGSGNTITDQVGQTWLRHPDARIGSPPLLTALSSNTKPMPQGSTITVGFTNPGAGTQGTAAAWYVPYVNSSAFGTLVNTGGTGTPPAAPSITATANGNTAATIAITMPTANLNSGIVQVQYRLTGTSPWIAAPSPPSYCTPGIGSLVDGFGNTWSLNTLDQVVVNGLVDTVTSGVTFLTLIGGTVWQQAGSWWSWTPTKVITAADLATNNWVPPAGVATSPFLSPGLVVSGLQQGTSPTPYDFTAYVSNTSGSGPLSNVAQMSTPALPAGIAALTANSFLASTGVNVHIDQGFGTTAPSYYIAMLQYLGIRNFRCGNGNLSTIQAVCSATGAKAVIYQNGGSVATFIANAKTLAQAGQLLALEGPNEPNNNPITYLGNTGGGTGDWLPVAEFVRDVYAAKAADVVLSAYPLYAASEPGQETTNAGLQFLVTPGGP